MAVVKGSSLKEGKPFGSSIIKFPLKICCSGSAGAGKLVMYDALCHARRVIFNAATALI